MTRAALLFVLLFPATLFGQTVKDPLAIVRAAREQVGVTTAYDPAYVVLSYPDGDVAAERGVCTDVVVRALRTAIHFDLQKAVHEDMQAHFSLYPRQWGLSKPDKNIDHRRVPNLQTYFRRHATVLSFATADPGIFLPGDLVTSLLPGNLPHIMIVSDKRNNDGVPFVIHNIGGGAREEDRLFAFPLTGHYRLNQSGPSAAASL